MQQLDNLHRQLQQQQREQRQYIDQVAALQLQIKQQSEALEQR